MATTHHLHLRHLNLRRRWLTGGLIGALLIPWTVSEARPVHEQLAVDPQGSIEIANAAGSVALSGWDRPEIEVKTVSGTIHVSGSGGEVEISTISGDASLDLESVTRGRFKSVSGGLTAGFALGADGRFEGESVSGNLELKFAGTPAAVPVDLTGSPR